MNDSLPSAAFLNLEDGRQVSVSDVLVTHPAFIIGTDTRAHLRLEAADTAPAHAAISLRAGDYIIQPRYPKLSIHVNDLPIKAPKTLLPGDRIQIGDVTLTFSLTGDRIALPADQPSAPQDAPLTVVTVTASAPARVADVTPPPAQPPIVYYPRSHSDTASTPSPLVAALGVIVVVAVMAFGVASRLSPVSAAAAPSTSEIELFYDDGNATLIMFDATWCQYCKQQKPTVEKLAADFRGDVYVTYVDIDTTANAELVRQYSATSIPRIVVLDDKGRVVNEFYGVQAESVLRQAVQSALTASNIN